MHVDLRRATLASVRGTSTLFSPAFKRVELAFILAAGGLWLLYLPRVEAAGLVNLPIALAMIVAADFVSGLFHWGFDTWGDESTPLLGPNIIRSFREHHTDQLGITRHTFVEANGGPAIGATVFLAAGLFLPTVASVAVLWLATFVFFTNVIHKWAHGAAPTPVRWLQRYGILLSPEHHAGHHRSPYDRSYCITVGWLNPLLDGIRFWEKLERAVTATTGVQPRGT